MWKLPLFDLNYDEAETEAVTNVLSGKWLTAGPVTADFEQKFADYLGGNVKALAVANCTAALQMALHLAGIKPGDEIIVPALTFVADLNVIALAGATPVLADVTSLTDWNISVNQIENAITSRTKAVIVVHYAGWPCDMDAIVRLCREKCLTLIEDVAHAPGARFKEQSCGTFGDISCFSFFSNKNLATGEGGMLVTREPSVAKRARLLRSHGMTSLTIDRHEGKTLSYDVLEPGFNFRFDEIRAALGRVQLTKLDDGNRKRKQLTERYITGLSALPEICIPWNPPPPGIEGSYHIFPVLLPDEVDRLAFMEHMKSDGIQTSIHYPAFRSFTAWKMIQNTPLPISDRICKSEVTLPLYPGMTDSDVKTVCQAILNFFRKNT